MNNTSLIKEFRIKKGYTQQDLADKLGVSKSAISRYESNERSLKIPLLKSIANALDVPVTKLVGMDYTLSNELYFDAIKNNIVSSDKPYIFNNELITAFKTLTVGLNIDGFVHFSDEKLLEIIQSVEFKSVLDYLLVLNSDK